MLTLFLGLILCTNSGILFRTSTCLREHEEFSLCGWRCPPTCVNLRLLATDVCPSTWDCRVGCRCAPGYVRDEYSKKCVLVQNCPGITVTMKAILLSWVFAVVALSVAGAPTLPEEELQYVSQQHLESQKQLEDFLRERRSQYAPQFVSPCAAASAMQVPVSSVQVPTFAAAPYQGYATVPQYGYAVPHFARSVDEDRELLRYSDMDQDYASPMARLGGYGAGSIAAPALSGIGSQVLTQGSAGNAIGVFPNAHVGGCAVPLLFSCSPSIVSGHIVESKGYAAPVSAVADSYRLVDEPVHHDVHEQHDDMLTHEHLGMTPAHETSHTTHQ